MEENIRLVKEYDLTYDTFKEAYNIHQKKKVYPKSYLFIAMYVLIAVIFIIKTISDGSLFGYVVIFIALGFAAIEWYTPRKIKASLFETYKAMGDTRYRFEIGGECVIFSTVDKDSVGNSVQEDTAYNCDGEADEEAENELPEKTVIPINDDLSVIEYDRFFLFYVQKRVFYIVPKEGFTEYDLETVREIGMRSNQSV